MNRNARRYIYIACPWTPVGGGMFKVADANHDGKLSSAEYANLPLIKRGGPGAPPLSAFDTSKDGALDEKEYLRTIEALVRAAESQGG